MEHLQTLTASSKLNHSADEILFLEKSTDLMNLLQSCQVLSQSIIVDFRSPNIIALNKSPRGKRPIGLQLLIRKMSMALATRSLKLEHQLSFRHLQFALSSRSILFWKPILSLIFSSPMILIVLAVSSLGSFKKHTAPKLVSLFVNSMAVHHPTYGIHWVPSTLVQSNLKKAFSKVLPLLLFFTTSLKTLHLVALLWLYSIPACKECWNDWRYRSYQIP
jgi:hypothetical protein